MCYLSSVMYFICAVCVMCLTFAVCVMCAACNICADLKSPYLKFLLFLKNVLVLYDSDQLTLNHCPPIHLHCPDCPVFVKGVMMHSGFFCNGGQRNRR